MPPPGGRTRAECFSGCNAAYACFELMGSGFDSGAIGPAARVMLSNLSHNELLHAEERPSPTQLTTARHFRRSQQTDLSRFGRFCVLWLSFTAAALADKQAVVKQHPITPARHPRLPTLHEVTLT